jgi:hypothetical protein
VCINHDNGAASQHLELTLRDNHSCSFIDTDAEERGMIPEDCEERIKPKTLREER